MSPFEELYVENKRLKGEIAGMRYHICMTEDLARGHCQRADDLKSKYELLSAQHAEVVLSTRQGDQKRINELAEQLAEARYRSCALSKELMDLRKAVRKHTSALSELLYSY